VWVPHDQGHPAMAANGFALGGTSFESSATTFTVVIPSTRQVRAAQLDPAKAQIGNSTGVISAYQAQRLDVTGDGLDDMVLTYRVKEAQAMPMEGWSSPLDGLAKAATVGYHALVFVDNDGSVYQVNDIYALGDPVFIQKRVGEEPEDDDGSIRDKEAQTMEPISSARQFDNGISSIYPNPFNPATTIRYTVAEPSNVKIAIYNVKGALVRLLVDTDMAAGEYDAPWDGTDSSGQTVATGVYFTRLVIGDFEMTRKMVLLK